MSKRSGPGVGESSQKSREPVVEAVSVVTTDTIYAHLNPADYAEHAERFGQFVGAS